MPKRQKTNRTQSNRRLQSLSIRQQNEPSTAGFVNGVGVFSERTPEVGPPPASRARESDANLDPTRFGKMVRASRQGKSFDRGNQRDFAADKRRAKLDSIKSKKAPRSEKKRKVRSLALQARALKRSRAQEEGR